MVILFDLDGTLLDHGATERAAATALHRLAGAAGPVDSFVAAWSAALERNFQRYLAGELSYDEQRRVRMREVLGPLADAEVDHLLARYLEAYLASSTLFPDVLPCLDRLAGHRLGIITNGHPDHQATKLDRCGLADRFECVLVSEACGVAKPSPAIFHQACARLGTPPGAAIYVGDRYDVDAEGARRAGLRGVWLDRVRAAESHHEPPIIASLDELDALV